MFTLSNSDLNISCNFEHTQNKWRKIKNLTGLILSCIQLPKLFQDHSLMCSQACKLIRFIQKLWNQKVEELTKVLLKFQIKFKEIYSYMYNNYQGSSRDKRQVHNISLLWKQYKEENLMEKSVSLLNIECGNSESYRSYL